MAHTKSDLLDLHCHLGDHCPCVSVPLTLYRRQKPPLPPMPATQCTAQIMQANIWDLNPPVRTFRGKKTQLQVSSRTSCQKPAICCVVFSRHRSLAFTALMRSAMPCIVCLS